MTAGTLTLGGTITATSVTIDSGATAADVATINANVTNNGTLLENNATLLIATGVQGILVINGNYTQGFFGTLNMLINGTTAGSGYDQLQISGTASLAGTLTVGVVSGYTIPTGHTFSMLTFGSRSGSFGTVTNDTGATLTTQYNSTDFNFLSRADVPPPSDDDVPADLPPPLRDEGTVVVIAALDDGWNEQPPVRKRSEEERSNDLFFTSMADEAPAEDDAVAAVWEDGLSLEELLFMPVRLPLAVVERMMELVG